MKHLIIAAVAAFAVADAAPDVTGTWQMGLQGGHVVPVALVLKQDGTVVTGTIALPTQNVGERKEVELEGAFDAGALKLAGNVEGAAEPTRVEIDGKLLDDGTMEGNFAVIAKDAHRGTWTAERLKERRP
jgi:hypothetical protein